MECCIETFLNSFQWLSYMYVSMTVIKQTTHFIITNNVHKGKMFLCYIFKGLFQYATYYLPVSSTSISLAQ